MRSRVSARLQPLHLALAAGMLLSLALIVSATQQWQQTRTLQRAQERAWAVERLQVLREPLQRWPQDRGLRQQLDDLVLDPQSGFAIVRLRDAQGVPLLQRGRYDALDPRLPPRLRDLMHGVRYLLFSHAGVTQLRDAQGRTLALADFRLRRGAGAGASADDPLPRFGRGAAVQAVLGLLLFAGFALALRRHLQPQIDWSQRLDWRSAPLPSGGSLAELESQLTETLRARVGRSLDGVHYALIMVGRDGRIRYLNSTAEQLTGWSSADAGGRLVYSVFHGFGDDGMAEITPAENCLREGQDIAPRPQQLRARHGDTHPIEVMACLLRDAEGVVEGAAMLFRDMSTEVQRQEDLRRQARLSQGVVDHLDEGLLTTDTAGVVRFANARAQRMFGYSREEMNGVTVTKLMPVPFLNTPDVRISDYIGARGNDKLPKVVGWRKDATTFPAELWVQPMNVDGSSGLVVIVRDITERLRSENLASRLGRLLDSASEEIYIFDAQTLYFLEVNRGAQRNLGYRPEQLAGMTPLELSEDLDAPTFQSYLARLRGGEAGQLSYRCRHRRADGTTYPVEVRLNFSREEEPPVFMAIAADISERQAAEERLHQLAHFDALTGLPNRNVLHDRLDQALLAAQRSARMVGVFFIDLDRFKAINDEHGHDVGDQVLKAVAQRLRQGLRSSDTVARLGGDEFVIVAPGLRAREDAARLAQKVLERFMEPLDIDGLQLPMTPSIGIALYPLVDADAEGLLRYADSAMYQSKQAGRGRYQIFETDLAPERRRWIELQRDVHTAIALNQLRLRFRPVLRRDGGLAALQLRVAWKHPHHGLIAAEETIAAAHRAGVLAELELWTLYRACEARAAARERGLALPPLLGELSAWQLRNSDCGRYLAELLDRFSVPPGELLLALRSVSRGEELREHEATRLLEERGLRFALQLDTRTPVVDGGLDYALLLAEPRSLETAAATVQALAQAHGAPLCAVNVNDDGQRLRVEAAGVDCLCGDAVLAEVGVRELDGAVSGRELQAL